MNLKPVTELLRRTAQLSLVALLCLAVACSEDDSPRDVADTEDEATEMSLGQTAMDDVSTFVENEGLIAGSGKSDAADSLLGSMCVSVSRNFNSTDSTLTLTFNGAPCRDGKVRSGTIVVSWDRTLTWRTVNKDVVVRSSNYTVNGYTHRFRTVHRLTVGMPQPTWTRTCNDTITQAGRNGQGLWQSNHTRVLTTGWNVNSRQRRWEVYGTTNGTSFRNITWNSTVNSSPTTDRLVFEPRTCFYPIQGRISITRSDRSLPRVITFGPGCLNTYQVTVGELTLRLPFR